MFLQLSFKRLCNRLQTFVPWIAPSVVHIADCLRRGGHRRHLVEVVFAGEGPKVIVCPLSMQIELSF